MASVTKRPNGQWRARYRDSAANEHARHFARRVDAQAWLDGVTTAV
ncbi:MAG: site-specific integrase, partial [Actinomycetota bacterium]|nr:site-specific integrase [Actinomycetota bacterium]